MFSFVLSILSFSLGPSNSLAGLLEDVVASFQTCGVVGQIELRDLVIGGEAYKKGYYLKIFQEAYNYGGMCGKSTLTVFQLSYAENNQSITFGNFFLNKIFMIIKFKKRYIMYRFIFVLIYV